MREEDQYDIATVKYTLYRRDGRGLLVRSVEWSKLEMNSSIPNDEMDIYCGNKPDQ